MAKKSKKKREKREELVNKYYELRKELKQKVIRSVKKITKRFITYTFN